jgi:hypothetical protein
MRFLFPTLILSVAAIAQETAPPPAMNAAEKAFQESMTNVTMLGFFTVGDSTELHDDKYIIERVTKVKDDVWKFEARVMYNKKDVKVALNVISLTRQGVGGLGVFDTRLVIYKGGYAGTWGGGDHGGKMFGNIVKNEAAEPPK